ncbi:MAG: hypothetical protein HYS39_02675 [Proteobacteria bacterium]|nr:hypothetical protein [Pseudomonadota bacterium]
MRLLEELKTCHIHLDRLGKAQNRIKSLLPLTQKTLQDLTLDDLAYLEFFTSRLAKLQDALGSKVFPLFLDALGESRPNDTAIDRLNKLEKLNIIASASRWKDLRDMRNTLAHDYPENTEFMVKTLNTYFLAVDDFKAAIENVERMIQEKLSKG